jgi:hypothetical protein
MLSDPFRLAKATNILKFQAGDEVVLAEGSNKFVRGKFLRLNNDMKWAAIEEGNGRISSHPVEWMRSYPETKQSTQIAYEK